MLGRALRSTFVVATLLQTRVPTGKNRGPEVGLLLSRPTTFQVTGAGAIDKVVAVCAESGSKPAISRTRASVRMRVVFISQSILFN